MLFDWCTASELRTHLVVRKSDWGDTRLAHHDTRLARGQHEWIRWQLLVRYNQGPGRRRRVSLLVMMIRLLRLLLLSGHHVLYARISGYIFHRELVLGHVLELVWLVVILVPSIGFVDDVVPDASVHQIRAGCRSVIICAWNTEVFEARDLIKLLMMHYWGMLLVMRLWLIWTIVTVVPSTFWHFS